MVECEENKFDQKSKVKIYIFLVFFFFFFFKYGRPLKLQISFAIHPQATRAVFAPKNYCNRYKNKLVLKK